LALFVTTNTLAQAEDPAPAAKPPLAEEAPQATEGEIEALVEQLGNSDFRVREQATNQLEALGEKARRALEGAAKNSPSLETRWRAQQILRRLEGGGVSRLDPDVQSPPSAGPSPRGQPHPGQRPSTQLGELLRRFEEMQKEFDKAGGAGALRETLERLQKELEESGLLDRDGRGGRGGLNPFRPGTGMPDLFHSGDTVEVEGLKLTKHWWRGVVTLEVAGKTPTDPATTYTGTTLEEILARNPELANHPGMAELKRKGADPFESAREALRKLREQGKRDGSGWRSQMRSGAGVSIRQSPGEVTVKITETDENGELQEKEYTGTSLEELKKQHPELAEKLDGMGGLRIHVGPPQILRPGQGLRDMLERFRRPVTPTPPSEAKHKGKARFGIGFARPELALAMHLGLDEGQGALVREVLPGSIAEGMGLERHDIIVRVGEWEVRDLKVLHEKLVHAADHPAEPFVLEVIRRGTRLELTR
jgi:hypothetical protein